MGKGAGANYGSGSNLMILGRGGPVWSASVGMHGYRVTATVFVGGAVMQLPVFPVGRSIRKAPSLV